jgi:uncharacterized membrane protein
MMARNHGLDTPRESRRTLRGNYDSEAFGRLSERFARFLGTARFLVYMTVFVFSWVLWNIFAPINLRWDDYPFIFLTLILSLQASYAAPLILLAQNRQEDRDRQQAEVDRSVASRTQADTEFLARELAAVRLALADMVTMDELRDHLEKLVDSVGELTERVAPQVAPQPE